MFAKRLSVVQQIFARSVPAIPAMKTRCERSEGVQGVRLIGSHGVFMHRYGAF